MMNFQRLRQQMAENAERIRSLVQGVSSEQARWRPDPGSWSLLEVVNHLYDEEREDFRVRLDIMLHRPHQVWPAIDPRGWVVKRNYNDQQLEASLENFLRERRASLEWLGELASPDWEATYEAPFGLIRAGDVFTAWVAHDLLHMRQLVELHRAYTLQLVEPYKADYAGPWQDICVHTM
jgi:hypothetical protein